MTAPTKTAKLCLCPAETCMCGDGDCVCPATCQCLSAAEGNGGHYCPSPVEQ